MNILPLYRGDVTTTGLTGGRVLALTPRAISKGPATPSTLGHDGAPIAIAASTRGVSVMTNLPLNLVSTNGAQFFLTDIPQGPSAYLNATYINFGRSHLSCIANNCLERAIDGLWRAA